MAKKTLVASAAAIREGRRKAGAKTRAAAGIEDGEIKIVDLKEGGLGWRITGLGGEPFKFNFGRVYLPPGDGESEVKLQVSEEAIDKALRAARAMNKRRRSRSGAGFLRIHNSASRRRVEARTRTGEGDALAGDGE